MSHCPPQPNKLRITLGDQFPYWQCAPCTTPKRQAELLVQISKQQWSWGWRFITLYRWHSFSPLFSETGRTKKTKKLPKSGFDNHLSQKHKQGEEQNPVTSMGRNKMVPLFYPAKSNPKLICGKAMETVMPTQQSHLLKSAEAVLVWTANDKNQQTEVKLGVLLICNWFL